jgi:hypothetical protein
MRMKSMLVYRGRSTQYEATDSDEAHSIHPFAGSSQRYCLSIGLFIDKSNFVRRVIKES